jgi:hypothetical protein
MVVQITVVAFYLLTAMVLAVPLPSFLGALLIPGEPRGSDGSGLD